MTVRVFIDDSGKNDPPVFVLGGVIGRDADCSRFSADWAAALERPPRVPSFKMKDAHARNGAFKGFTVADRDAKVAGLAEVLRNHALATISVTVRHEDYAKVFEDRMMRWMDRPYQLLFHLVISRTYALLKKLGIDGKAGFVFDRQLEHEAALRASFASLKPGLGPEIASWLDGDPRHADDLDELPLQAADMVAWHVRRSWRDGGAALARASAAGPVLAALPGSHQVLDPEVLRAIADVATRVVRNLRTVFPYEAARMAEDFDGAASFVNRHLMAKAHPSQPVELISFPAIGTARFQLVSSCASLRIPHLHRRSGSECLGEATSVARRR